MALNRSWINLFKIKKNLKHFASWRSKKFMKMATCSSNMKLSPITEIYVISTLPDLSETFYDFITKGVDIINVPVPENIDESFLLNDEQLNLLKGAKVVVADANVIANNFSKLPSLEWVHCTWAGVEPIIKAFPEEPPFILTRHGGHDFSVLIAEYVMTHVLNYERKTRLVWKCQAEKKWDKSSCITSYRQLKNLTIGILGTGNMGSAIAEFFSARGTQVLGFSKSGKEVEKFIQVSTDLEYFKNYCDYIINALPSTGKTRCLLTSSFFKECKKAPVFINVGRGDVIKEEELILSLKNGWISGAILDVFENEPLSETSPLWEMPNVTITPHVAALSKPVHVVAEFYKCYILFYDTADFPNRVSWDDGY